MKRNTFEEALRGSAIGNIILAYWLSTAPHQPTVHWLGFYVVMGTVNYALLTIHHALRYGRTMW